MLPGLFVGYQQHAGGGWTEDVLLVDWEELDNASHVSEVYPRRTHFKESVPTLVDGEFVFPLAQAMLKQPGNLRPKVE